MKINVYETLYSRAEKIETNIIGNAKLVKIEKFSNTNLYAYKRKQNVSCT